MLYLLIAVIVVAFLAYQHLQSRLWHKKFELLCLRIQAPEVVVAQTVPEHQEMPEGIDPESDEDYWEAQGVDPGEPITHR
jgi:hypothetical protein